jgi:SAM-dependent methyltransferase
LQTADPAFVTGLDRSPGYVTLARASIQDRRVQFEVADAAELAVESGRYEAVVSGLMLNFLPQPELGAAEMRRATRFDGCVAAYVWDYAGKMEMTRRFWDAAAALDPRALQLDQGVRFPLCKPDRLIQLFQEIGLRDVEARPIDIPTVFRSFDDYWLPFLGGEGSAPGYVKSLSVEQLMTLRERIRAGLPFADDGSIPLAARAWAVRGYK